MTKDHQIIDADVHIHEDPHQMAEFAESGLRSGLQLPDAEKWLDTPGYSPLTQYDPPLGQDLSQPPHLIRDAATLRADLSSRGIDAAIVYTGRLLGTGFGKGPGYAVAISQIYNRYLNGRWLDPARGIYGALMLAAQDAKWSAGEIERYADVPGFAAVYLPLAGINPFYGDRRYDPIFAAAAAAGLPVVFQGYTAVYPTFPHQMDLISGALTKQIIARPFAVLANFASMVSGGVFARHPGLRVVFAECGLSWLPLALGRLDAQYPYLQAEVPFYRSAPAAQVRQQVFTTTHKLEPLADPAALFALLGSMGLAAQILFATDWPHYDADSLSTVRDLPLADDLKARILGGNARAIFKLNQAAPVGAG